MRGMPPFLAMIAMLILAVSASAGEWPRVELERPIAFTAHTTDGRTLGGKMTAYDGTGFDLRREDDLVMRIAWREMPPARTYQALNHLLDPMDPEASLRLGELLMMFGEEGRPHAERALKRAEALDASLGGRIEAVRRGEPDPGDDVETSDEAAGGGGAAGSEGGAGTPQTRGPVQSQFWGELSEADHAATVKRLHAFATESLKRLGIAAPLHETDFFLFYSDLPAEEAREWASLLDRMYDRLCELFGVPRGDNLWRGKCLVFVFAHEADYRRFETEIQGAPPSTTAAGRCWQSGDGRVVIAFYRQPSRWIFAHILVHETVHGFLHRYRSPARIDSAWNEGLAEVIASELVPQSPIRSRRRSVAADELRARKNTGGFFQAEQIESWQYGVALTLTEYMIAQNKKGYVAFINGIKDGMAWEESLEEHYGVDLDRLMRFYSQSMRVGDLRP